MNYLFVENSNSMNLLFKEIRKFKPLNKDEEIELFNLAKAGDKFAKDKLNSFSLFTFEFALKTPEYVKSAYLFTCL